MDVTFSFDKSYINSIETTIEDCPVLPSVGEEIYIEGYGKYKVVDRLLHYNPPTMKLYFVFIDLESKE